MQIEASTAQHLTAIAAVVRRAFPAEERDEVADLATALESLPSDAGVLGLVARSGETVIGYVAFSPVVLARNNSWRGFNLSPLAVDPDYQAQGVGSALVKAGIESLRKQGVVELFVYGDPAYYGRFGFNAAAAERFKVPFPLTYPFGWQGLSLGGNDTSAHGMLSFVQPLNNAGLW